MLRPGHLAPRAGTLGDVSFASPWRPARARTCESCLLRGLALHMFAAVLAALSDPCTNPRALHLRIALDSAIWAARARSQAIHSQISCVSSLLHQRMS